MKHIVFICVLSAAVGFVLCITEIPKDYNKCSIGPDFDKCMVDALNDAFPKIIKGYKELGLPQLDPLVIPHIKIDQSTGPVTLKQEFKNLNLKNLLRNAKVEKFSLDLSKKEIQFNFVNEGLETTAECDLNGKILLLPLNGHGQCSQFYKRIGINLIMKFEEKKKGDDTYWHFKQIITRFDKPEKLTIHFENLFNGNKELGDSTNKFLNENWEDFFKELAPYYAKSFDSVVLELINKFFDQMPINKIFQ